MNARSIATLVVAFLLVAQGHALACACCAEDGDHTIQMVKAADLERSVMRRLRFGPTAALLGGERDLAEFVGLKTPAGS